MTDRGTLLGGRYELDQVIGRGGMAEVWRARDTRLARDVAVKRLRIDLASDQTFQARFRREAQSAAGLNHPNIVAVYDTGEELDVKSDVSVPYIVMELVEGVTLRDVLRDGRKIVPERAMEFTAGVLEALSYAHRSGIVHRDIKPANVMLTPSGTVKVMDFGIARAVADTSATMTQTAAVIGTAQYLSPEQARGEKVDHRSDLYSVGCLLYELLVSQPPFTGDSPVSVAYQHVRENPVPPSQIDPEISPEMDAIVLKALAKDPDQRYQDAREMRDDLVRAINNQPVHAEPPTAETAAIPQVAPSPEPVAPALEPVEEPGEVAVEEEPRSSKKLVAWLVVAGLVLVGVITAIAIALTTGPEEEEQVQVPSVVGLDEEMAKALIKDNGLEPKVHYQVGTAEDKGKVVNQYPTAQAKVKPNSVVNLTVSQGPEEVTVPDKIVGMTRAEAERALGQLGLKPKFIDAEPATEPITAKEGTVTAASPAPGAAVAKGSEVTVSVATGRSLVPQLIGTTEEEAKQLAQEAGFTIRVTRQETDAETAGQVFKQSPSAQDAASRSEPIQVTVAVPLPEPPPTVEAPPTTEAPPPPPEIPQPTESEVIPAPPTDQPTQEQPDPGQPTPTPTG